MPDNSLTIHKGVELSLLSTEQLDQLPVIDLHTSLLVEDSERIPSLIQKLSSQKLMALIDLSSWEKDRFSAMDFATWINVIMTLEPMEALREIKRLDREELTLFLSEVLEIRWYDPDQTYDSNAVLTQDNVFIILPKLTPEGHGQSGGHSSPELFDLCIELINIAYLDEETNLGRALCIDSINVIPSTQEEECYKLKNSRLSDEGIPTYVEALELFYFEDPTKLLKKLLASVGDADSKKSSPSHDYVISSFTVVPKAYWDSMFKVSDALLQDLQVELSALLTSSIVVNNVLDGGSKEIGEVIERSKSYFNLGLELIKENSTATLEDVLNYIKLRDVFRLGFSLLVDLKRNAGKIKAAVDALKRPDILSADEKEFVDRLLDSIPMYQKSLEQKAVAFEKLEQLKEARRMLSDIAGRMVKK